ncbi:SRPBCC domain-containing protein [Emticicia soli]|uniref:SRPBCC domain-containing protein n=1 Tax=Emticicia soli TaxID=2027878 RepID=A0ABW5JHG2_9BACT
MNTTQEALAETAPEIVSTRVFNVSRELLFRAYTDPEILQKWWGPKGFTNTFHEFNLQAEGEWNFTMHGPDGVDYKNKIVFIEIVPHEKIIFHHVSGPKYRGCITFTNTSETAHTHLTYSMTLQLPKVYSKLKDLIIVANEENFDRLEEVFRKIKKK